MDYHCIDKNYKFQKLQFKLNFENFLAIEVQIRNTDSTFF